jgi:hypothetical protein
MTSGQVCGINILKSRNSMNSELRYLGVPTTIQNSLLECQISENPNYGGDKGILTCAEIYGSQIFWASMIREFYLLQHKITPNSQTLN